MNQNHARKKIPKKIILLDDSGASHSVLQKQDVTVATVISLRVSGIMAKEKCIVLISCMDEEHKFKFCCQNDSILIYVGALPPSPVRGAQ